MEERAHGIILRTRPLTDTSLIVQWLTAEFGRVSTVAKGARRPKSPYLGKVDLFYEAEFSFQRSRRSTLHNLREVSLRDPHAGLRTDMEALTLAARASRLLEQTTEEDTPCPELFALFHSLLLRVAAPCADPLLARAFEIRLLNILGFRPELPSPGLTPGSTRLLEQLLMLDWDTLTRLKPSPAQAAELRHFLEAHLRDSADARFA